VPHEKDREFTEDFFPCLISLRALLGFMLMLVFPVLYFLSGKPCIIPCKVNEDNIYNERLSMP